MLWKNAYKSKVLRKLGSLLGSSHIMMECWIVLGALLKKKESWDYLKEQLPVC